MKTKHAHYKHKVLLLGQKQSKSYTSKNLRFDRCRNYSTTLLPAHDTMNIWSSVKRRMKTKRAKAIKKKAAAAGELVVAGAALTGGALLL